MRHHTYYSHIPVRRDDRIILHFDYDCFYASVVEAENPSLKTLPLAIQQKQIIVTCNYEARRRGLYKLQLITEAKAVCPEVVIVLGEDLTRFRNASKDLYGFLRKYSWNDKVERLGFDEVWMDVTDVVEYNVDMLNKNVLKHSFFQTVRDDPTQGFPYDATHFAGHTHPRDASKRMNNQHELLTRRLVVGSHLAMHLRHTLEEEKGYTCTVGISTSRLLAKLVGNVNKPRGQTTLIPPYEADPPQLFQDNVQAFMGVHDIGKIPWIGFKSAQKLREAVLQRPADFQTGLVYGGSKESVTVDMVLNIPDITIERLEKILGGPGQPRGIGKRVWGLLHGIDGTEVGQARNVPRQISIEDSYVRLDTTRQLMEQLTSLSARLLERMRIDLLDHEIELDNQTGVECSKSSVWIGRPHTLRLTTRPRLPVGPDGTRPRTFKRISRSGIMPSFVFNNENNVESLAQRLVSESLIPLFKKLHAEKSGWNLSLVNVAATDMVYTGADSKAAVGRNIQSMFQNQAGILKDFQLLPDTETFPDGRVEDPVNGVSQNDLKKVGSPTQEHPQESPDFSISGLDTPVTLFNDDEDSEEIECDNDDDDVDGNVSGSQGFECSECGEMIPEFARKAHERFHRDAG